ncbi:MAG: indole-3-glycerol phosphate synthase TrpC [Planctomycetaceae bacterium]|nr:indole-3-glycerol phosphate synthase TrpC [Planctomycetaceae bacterium]
MATILDKIIDQKRLDIAAAKARVSFETLQSQLSSAPPVRGFLKALKAATAPALIAEVKKASPSAGLIRPDFDPVAIARDYQLAGAACLSILTDEKFFQGHLDYLRTIRQVVEIPVMRKEFIIDRYQVLEARVAGADCILLIAECLDDSQLNDLYNYARELGMDVLIELYDLENVPRVMKTGTKLLGVNNRDLRTFVTSMDHTFTVRQQVPEDVLLVSESGIGSHDDILRLRAAGIGAVLVGESLMRQPSVPDAVRRLMHGN